MSFHLKQFFMSLLHLADFQISPRTGFLPENPCNIHPARNQAWYSLAASLPKTLLTGKFKELLEHLPDFEEDTTTPPEFSMLILSYLGHAYLWGDVKVPQHLPKNLALAWTMVAQQTGRPPILSYPSYCLYNHRVINPEEMPFIGNIEMIQNFLGGADEDWFILIHVDIEARAAQAIRAIPSLLLSAVNHDITELIAGLQEVQLGLSAVNTTMNRMPEYCNPYIYYTRVRPYIFGTKNNPDLPNGLIYEGCFDNAPQFYRGETGAQSSIVPTMDGLLGVFHKDDPLKDYLMEMRTYMVPAHCRFIEVVENTSQIRQRVQENKENQALVAIYNACVDELFKFRAKHLEYAATYIHKQALQANNSNVVGTGGTPFMEYLAKHRDETLVQLG
jgi:indoleamine 2,3-dioxygenase